MNVISPETQARLDAAKAGLEAANLIDFGIIQNTLEIPEPLVRAVPHVWKWEEVSPWLDKVYHGMSLHEVHRRTLGLCNPGLNRRPFAVSSLLTSMSIYYPGDLPETHRHSASASRFLLHGKGAYTTVGNEKCPLDRGDLVITPNGEWHDHGNDGTDPIIWVNVLDIPMTEFFNAIFTDWDYHEQDSTKNGGEPQFTITQTFLKPAGYSDRLFGTGGIVPRFGPEQRGRGVHSPKYLYRWAETRPALLRMKEETGCPYDGIIVEYVNPVNGASVVPTMSFRAQMLREGEATRTHRHTSSTVYAVIEGEGYTEVNGEKFHWKENDIFAVPGWMFHRHVNGSDGKEAFLYSVSDSPVHHKLHFYREQELTDSGDIVEIWPWPQDPQPGIKKSNTIVVG